MAAALKRRAAKNVQNRLGKYIKTMISGTAAILHMVRLFGWLNLSFNLRDENMVSFTLDQLCMSVFDLNLSLHASLQK